MVKKENQMKKINVRLKQHTPLIHFQGNVSGATLRASEVKPKLDRWLINKFNLAPNGEISEMYQGQFISKDHLSLDYSLRIYSDSYPQLGNVTLMPGNDPEPTILQDDVKLEIKSRKCNLLNKEILADFFAVHNFGKRQSKGFGSFTVEGFNAHRILENQNLFKKNINENDFYRVISEDWRILKSGKNHNGYVKSKLFHFALEMGLRWDKRFIKKKLYQIISRNNWEELRYEEEPNDAAKDHHTNSYNSYNDNPAFNYSYAFVRALLGLPEHYEFRAANRIIYHVKINSNEIERFKSPITFKVVDNMCYVIIGDIPSSIFGHEFNFNLIKKQNNHKVAEIDNFASLSTPSQFDLNLFISNYIIDLDYE